MGWDLLGWGWELAPPGWEAVVGLAAVVAAYKVGKRQASIASRQTALQEATLRETLFDRRWRVYEITIAALQASLSNRQDIDLWVPLNELYTEVGKSKFLFSAGMQKELEKAYKAASRHTTLWQMPMVRYAPRQQQLLSEERGELHQWLLKRQDTLSDLFAGEMGLSDQPASVMPATPELPKRVNEDSAHPDFAEFQREMVNMPSRYPQQRPPQAAQ